VIQRHSVLAENIPYITLMQGLSFRGMFNQNTTNQQSREILPQGLELFSANPESLVFDLFNVGHNTPGMNLLSDRKHVIIRLLESSMLEQREEIENRVEKLFGPDGFLESLRIAAYFISNNLLGFTQQRDALDWFASQSESFLNRMFAVKLPSIRACFDTLMQLAIERGSSTVFKILFYANINDAVADQRRLEETLLGALQLGLGDVVKVLLENAVDVNAQMSSIDSFGKQRPRTFLGAAGTAEVAEMLLKLGAWVNVPSCEINQKSTTYLEPVYRALMHGEMYLTQVLIQYGAMFSPNFSIPIGLHQNKSLLFFAIERGDSFLVKWLLRRGAEYSNSVYSSDRAGWATEIQAAAFFGNEEIVSILLTNSSFKRSFRESEYCWAPLRDAALEGHTRIVELLLEAGVDVDASSRLCENKGRHTQPMPLLFPSTALFAALKGRHAAVVDLLLRKNVNINAIVGGRHALGVAADAGDHGITTSLVQAGAKMPLLSSRQKLELRCASRPAELQLIRFLTDAGVDLSDVLNSFPSILYRLYT
jgi:hypothetical protein